MSGHAWLKGEEPFLIYGPAGNVVTTSGNLAHLMWRVATTGTEPERGYARRACMDLLPDASWREIELLATLHGEVKVIDWMIGAMERNGVGRLAPPLGDAGE